MKHFARVAIDSAVQALDRPFDYAIPERMAERVSVGSVVRVVLHGRNVRAFVVELLDDPAVPDPKPLSSLVSPQPVFSDDTVKLARWTAHRYVVPLGLVLHDAVPGRFSTPQAPAATQVPRVPRPGWFSHDLSEGQMCVVVPTPEDEVDLIAHAVGEAAAHGKRSLVIAPRVAIVERLADAIGGSAVLHGDDRPADRAEAWAAARDGRVDVVIGGRSALFVPIPDLGLVAVASAHERTLKSERAPRLHALQVARERARMSGATFVATSPAPPLELADGSLQILTSRRGPTRPQSARPRKGPVTPRLVEVVTSTIAEGSDVLVFAGRRGGSLRLRCTDCGWTPACAVCGTGLAIATSDGVRRLMCRVCGETADVPDACAACAGTVSERGWGHERVARELAKATPEIAVVPLAAGDVVTTRDAPTVFVGTIAAAYSGMRFGAICVADLDQLLGRPDFRAAEYALQTLYDLAAVLDRGGRFLVQTREPEHHVVQAFTRGSYTYFMERELPLRQETGYPPYGTVARVELKSDDLPDLRSELDGAARVVGTVPRRGRLVALVRSPELEPILDPLRRFVASHRGARVDVDPTDVT